MYFQKMYNLNINDFSGYCTAAGSAELRGSIE